MPETPTLVPYPRQLQTRPGRCELIENDAKIAIDPSAMPNAQGYRLTVTADAIVIVAHDEAGVFYARQTLKQLMRQGGRGTPCVEVEDWPDIAVRGLMLDISRNKVPTMATLFGLVDKLTELKLNQLQLYTEHTFAYEGHEKVWATASPMTGDQIEQLDAYCRDRFIELVPNQNTFGHMERWFMHEPYRALAECPTGFEYATTGGWRGPTTLCPGDPGSITLIEDLLDQLLPRFASRHVNVGGDEPWELGKGRSAEDAERRGLGRVYLDYIHKLSRAIKDRDHTMMLWGDIIQNHPELIPDLPPDLIALEWGYSANHDFDTRCGRLAEAGVPFYICPGTSTWNSITGRSDEMVANQIAAARAARDYGAIGHLNTDWGDHGHWQPLPVSYLGYAMGAAMSWCAASNTAESVIDATSMHLFHDDSGATGRFAYDLGNAYLRGSDTTRNNDSAVVALLYLDEPILADLGTDAVKLRETERSIDEVMSRFEAPVMPGPEGELIAQEFRVSADLLRHGCRLGIARAEAEGQKTENIAPAKRKALADELNGIIPRYRENWLARNREGGLPESVAWFEKLITRYVG